MSYILDALKKAEAERRQEQVPGLLAQPLPVAPAANRQPAWMRPAIVGGVAVLAILAGLLWWQPWRAAPENAPTVHAVAPAPATPVAAPAAVPAATPVAPVAPAVTAPAATAPLAQAATPAVTPSRPASEEQQAAPPARKRHDPDKPKAKPEAAKKARSEERSPPAVSEKPRASPPPAAAEETITALRDLPDAVQRSIPQISVGGYIYADKPAGRSVLINKRLVREGDQVAPDLILERMTPNGMVFNYKGTRFRTSY